MFNVRINTYTSMLLLLMLLFGYEIEGASETTFESCIYLYSSTIISFVWDATVVVVVVVEKRRNIM